MIVEAFRRRRAALVLTSLMLSVGCAGNRALSQADIEMERGNLDTAIAQYQRILLEDPGNTDAKIKLGFAKLQASQQHERSGVSMIDAGDYQSAVSELQLAVRLDPTNEMALRELGRAQQLWIEQQRAAEEELTPTELAMREAQAAAPVVPALQTQVTGPISFDFRDAPVREIYRTLAQVAGLNVLFESTLGDDIATFQVAGTTFEDALHVLTTSNGHFIKVLSPNTFMVIPDDITKRREYADQVMRTFYLSNADVSIVEQQIRAILATQQVSSNPELNTITVRDTPEALEVIAKLVESADKAVGEILLEVEVLEVSSEVVADYGLALEPFSGSAQVLPQSTEDGEFVGRSVRSLGNLTTADVFVSIPSLFYQFLRTTNDFKLVAQPKLRATEGETTTLLIGEEVPVVTTTFNPQATVGGNVVPVSSTEYRDTGIELTVLPRVHFNGEITLEVEIQVSAVTATATVASVGDLPVFTTRRVAGKIRLRDGETNIIAGLLQDNDIRHRRGIIGLDNVPGVGDALSDTESTRDQTDIVISITPHLLRAAQITAADLRPVYVGTQSAVTGGSFAGGTGAVGAVRPGGPSGAPAGPGGAAAAGAAAATPAATLSLLPSENIYAVGDEFALDVTVNSADEVYSAGFQLQFDPTVVSYVSYFEGGFLNRDGAEMTLQVTDGGPGIVRVGMTRMGSEVGVAGGGSLVTLVFRAAGEGASNIEITSAALRLPLGGPLAVQMNGASVSVRQQRE